jgi:hypothetical protein
MHRWGISEIESYLEQVVRRIAGFLKTSSWIVYSDYMPLPAMDKGDLLKFAADPKYIKGIYNKTKHQVAVPPRRGRFRGRDSTKHRPDRGWNAAPTWKAAQRCHALVSL